MIWDQVLIPHAQFFVEKIWPGQVGTESGIGL